MATLTPNIVLTDDWLEVSEGPVSIVMVSGSAFWALNGPTIPTDDKAFVPITSDFGQAAYSYGGTEKTFCKRTGSAGSANAAVVSVTEIS